MSAIGPVLGGLLGPLAATVATWFLVTRAHRRNPATVTNLMVAAFAVKMVFFGVYCVVMVKVVGLSVASFGLWFAMFFIAFYGVEAALFMRVFRGGSAGAR